jgi:hypothetical protein
MASSDIILIYWLTMCSVSISMFFYHSIPNTWLIHVNYLEKEYKIENRQYQKSHLIFEDCKKATTKTCCYLTRLHVTRYYCLIFQCKKNKPQESCYVISSWKKHWSQILQQKRGKKLNFIMFLSIIVVLKSGCQFRQCLVTVNEPILCSYILRS